MRRTLWATLRDLAGSGRGVVLTTHYLEEADALADRIVVLNRGRVIAEGSPSQVKSLVPGRRISAESTVAAAEASRWAGSPRDARRFQALLLVSEAEPVVRELLARDRVGDRADGHRTHPGGRLPDPDQPH